MTFVRALWFLLTLPGFRLVAQPTGFGCSEAYGQAAPGENATFTRDTDLRFAPLSDARQIARIRKLPAKSLTGFARQYGVRGLEFFTQFTPSENIQFEPGSALLYVEVQSAAGGSAFYALLRKDGLDGAFDVGSAERLAVFAATPDKKLPLVILQTSARFMGANSGNETASRLLLDFRAGRPRTIGTLDCDDRIRGGACTAFDEGFEPEGRLECDWASDRTDFRCTQTKTSKWNWGNVDWKERFYLISGEAMGPSEVAEQAPGSPYDWAVALVSSHADARGKRIVLPQAGDTFVLEQIGQPEIPHGTIVLLASRGDTGHLWPRFHLAVVGQTNPAPGHAHALEVRTLEIAARHGENDEANATIQSDGPGILDGKPMRFVVKPLKTADSHLHFYQVLLLQNRHHALFWVGIDARHEPYRGQALLIATDALEYDHCRWAHITDSAARAQWSGGEGVLATLNVEPRRYLDYDGDGYFDSELDREKGKGRCPYALDLGWSYEKGWLMNPRAGKCDQAKMTIRAVAISDQGDISAKPATLSHRDQQ